MAETNFINQHIRSAELDNELRHTPPIELMEFFVPTDKARFELVRHAGTVRLWKSTVTRQFDDAPAYEVIKHHVTDYDVVACIFMSNFENALGNFDLARAGMAATV